MITLLYFISTIYAQDNEIAKEIQSARASISEADKRQREALSHLFVLNKKIREIARTHSKLSTRLMEQEGSVQILAHEVGQLEERTETQKTMLNKRLRQLYQNRKSNPLHWFFSAVSPMELERNHRFMRKMIDSDHKRLRTYLVHLRELQAKRNVLRSEVTELLRLQKRAQGQEQTLIAQQRAKARFVNELKKSKDSKMSELKELREQTGDQSLSYAFFERRGNLRLPVAATIARTYGTIKDAQFHFQLMHKGLFFKTPDGTKVKAVSDGTVVVAEKLPGYGRTAIVDHGDNYYTVYAHNRKLFVRQGQKITDGDVVAATGASSPLFGPGLYFEIRHFTDAIDPRSWIKESVIKTATN